MIWTLGLVIGLGVLSATFLLEPPMTLKNGSHHSAASEARPNHRSPASIQKETFQGIGSAPSGSNGRFQAVEYELPCQDNETSFDESVAQVRLSGAPCVSGEIVASEIKNLSNGFSATVFIRKPASFTTDYISLARGENKVSISHTFSNGSTETRAFVIRRQNE